MNTVVHGKRYYTGFTLLEVVIAITIFAICITVVYSLYASVISVVKNVEQDIRTDHAGRVVLERIDKDLNGIYMGKQGVLLARESSAYYDEDPFLTLTTSAHLVLDSKANPVDISIVRYYLEENRENKGLSLFRSDVSLVGKQDVFDVEGTRHLLSRDVREFSLKYTGEDGAENEIWNSITREEIGENQASRFPRAFHLVFTLGDDEKINDNAARYIMTVVVSPQVIEFGVEP